MDYGFISALADDLESFVNFKRAMGYKYGQSTISHLRSFDRYCENASCSCLTRNTAETWLALQMERSSSTNTLSQISIIREFGKYLHAKGDADAFILPPRYRTRPRIAVPYLLSEEEIATFFNACDEYESVQRGQVRKILYSGIFQMMHACGIRPCEAMRLTCDDVDLESASIDIIDSKGPKSRRLYLNDEMTDFLIEYDDSVTRMFPGRRTFFPSLEGGMLTSSFINRGFNHIWDRSGLLRPKSGSCPRPYSFRHHFAFANIARWAEEGRDVMAMMPYLARYMGHVNIASTYYYIHLSPDIVADIPASTRLLEKLLPEVVADD